ncbi:autotransporter domain-containing protein [Phragmitibacter flavus]|uniref:Autotransporter domain-containing protein n=1 Tax=Phragmitibacter flavus TaxID=2576071 RepID=A0A5R8KDH6_9BACT|nr:autotransporter domain-containing protein [Phragmitibacter flavus]TLD69639.1 autotransporter domain-containing protein [Phragmitibacter flavus]
MMKRTRFGQAGGVVLVAGEMHSKNRSTEEVPHEAEVRVNREQGRSRWILCLVMPIALGLLAHGMASGQSVWNAGSADWFVGTNWTPNGVPALGDSVTIDNGGMAMIGAVGAEAGTTFVDDGQILVSAGGGLTTNGVTFLGNVADLTGVLVVNGAGANWKGAGIYVAREGNGVFQVSDGGTAENFFVAIADSSDSFGTAIVTGAGSTWTTLSVEVGQGGEGRLNIENGGVMTSDASVVETRIGYGDGSKGTVLVDGPGSNWTINGGPMILADRGEALMTVSNTATVIVDGEVFIGLRTGNQSEGNGVLDVESGGMFTSGAGITIGGDDVVNGTTGGDGEMRVTDAGKVVSGGASFIGRSEDSVGFVQVSGVGSSWVLGGGGGALTIGEEGRGVLSVDNEGLVRSGSTTLGGELGAIGSGFVTGAGSLWEVSGALVLGDGGHGIFNVVEGAKLTAASGLFGAQVGSEAYGKVSDAGSRLEIAGNLVVAELSAMAGLEAMDGGGVSVGMNLGIGNGAGSDGYMFLSGQATEGQVAGTATIGRQGNGRFTIGTGARLTTGSAIMGELDGFSRGIMVGEGAEWVVNGDMVLSDVNSEAQLVLLDGAEVSTTGFAVIGRGADSDGLVRVEGLNSEWTIGGYLGVGDAGVGQLNVKDGGFVSAAGTTVGVQAGGDGGILVQGATSSMEVTDLTVGLAGAGEVSIVDEAAMAASGNVLVGGDALGEGTLMVANGGTFSSASMVVANAAGSTGEVVIGDGLAPGVIDTPVITGGAGDASVTFNHNSAGYVFDPLLTGNLDVFFESTGTTIFDNANTYVGSTTVASGQVVTLNSNAFGTGPLLLNGGVLAPQGLLQVDSSVWSGGQLFLTPAIGDQLQVVQSFNNGGGGEFLIGVPGLELTTYDLVTFATSDFTEDQLSAVFDIQNVEFDYDLLLTPDRVQLTILGATATGEILQNSAPVLIPTFADFIVNGQVRTGELDENNTIRSLIFLSGSRLQVYNQLTVSSGEFTVVSGRSVVQGGTVFVPGEFYKLGAGTLDARSSFVVAGNSFIRSGALAVNGTFQTPLLVVSPGGTLMGEGLVIGNVLNSGTVAPGNSIGELAILGDYRQTRQGTLQIEVGSVNRHDVLSVSGLADLDGTLEIASLGYRPKYGDQVPFLRAGRITGTFDEILMPDPEVKRGRFLNLGNVGVLLVAPTSYTLVAETHNQTRVAAALDEWIGIESGDVGSVTLALDLLREEQYPQAFEAIMPGFYDAALSTAIELSHGQGQLLHQQLSARRIGDRLKNRPVLAASSTDSGKGAKLVKHAIKQVAQVDENEYRWSAWMQGSGLFSRGGLSLVPGENFESGTFITGADYALSDQFALGIFAGYSEGWGDYDNGGEIDLERILFGTYATVDIGNFYLNTALGIGTVDYDINRPIQFATLNRSAGSEPDGHEFFALLGGGYDFRRGNWTFGPQASLQYSKVSLDSFTESGADSLNLRMNDPDSDSLRSYLGARVAYTIKATDRVAIIPELRAFWQHEFLDGDELNASLDGGSGPDFAYESERDDKDALFVGAGLGLQVGPRFYANLYYNVDLGRNDPNHNISISATIRF